VYPDVAPVTGTVTLDGQPLEGVRVSFIPDGSRGSTGKTDAQGKYELRFVGPQMGAKVGSHTVLITTSESSDDTGETSEERVPAKYNAESELTAEVKPEAQSIDFALTSSD